MKLNIVFEDIAEKHEMMDLRFVEVEDEAGKSIKAGEWKVDKKRLTPRGRFYSILEIDCDKFASLPDKYRHEIANLCKRVDELLKSNNEYLERARTAERNAKAYLSTIEVLSRLVHDMIKPGAGEWPLDAPQEEKEISFSTSKIRQYSQEEEKARQEEFTEHTKYVLGPLEEALKDWIAKPEGEGEKELTRAVLDYFGWTSRKDWRLKKLEEAMKVFRRRSELKGEYSPKDCAELMSAINNYFAAEE